MGKDGKKLALGGAALYALQKSGMVNKISRQSYVSCSSSTVSPILITPKNLYYDRNTILKNTENKNGEVEVTYWKVELCYDKECKRKFGYVIGETISHTVNEEHFILDEKYTFFNVANNKFLTIEGTYQQTGNSFTTTVDKIMYNVLNHNFQLKREIKSVEIDYTDDVRKITFNQ